MKKYIEILLLTFIFLLGFFLRVYKLDTVPPGLNQDEISIGYNAEKILHTGKDEYKVSFPIFFRSLDDYKLGGYIYLTSLSIAVFGENDFAIRFPSALFGSLTMLVMYFFVKELFYSSSEQSKSRSFQIQPIPLLSSFLLAISSWHLQFSRVAFESATALFFFLTGCWLFLIFSRKRKIVYILLGVLFFAFSAYTYHTYQVLSPLTVVISGVWWMWKNKNWKKILLGIILFFLVITPLFFGTIFGAGLARSSQVSAFTNLEKKSLIAKVYLYPFIYINNYFSYYSFPFLFVSGDEDGQHQVPGVASMPSWEFPFLLFGIYALFKGKNLPAGTAGKNAKYLLFGLLIITPLVPAVAMPSPNTLRGLPMVLPLIILAAFGIWKAVEKVRWKWIVISIIITFCLVEFSQYLYAYYAIYPVSNVTDWGSATKQIVLEAEKDEKKYGIKKIVIDENMGLVSVAFPFYTQDAIPKPIYVSSNWQKPQDLESTPVLFIKPFSKENKKTSSFAELLKL